MFGQAMPSTCFIWSSGMLRISKMPPCLASTRNSTLSLIFVVTVAITVTSNMPSLIGSAPSVRLISTCGWPCSSRTCGAFGCSSDKSFRYMRWIMKVGVFCVSSAMRSSRENEDASPGGDATGSPAAWPGRRLCRAGEQRLEAAGAIERDQLVAAADMRVADEDLRHGVAMRQLDHRLAFGRPLVDADLVDRLDAALRQQRLRAQAVGAASGAEHLHGLHRDSQAAAAVAVFSTGRLAARQALRPPASTRVSAKRSLFSTATARCARAPVAQTTTSGSDLFFGRSRELSRLASGTLRAPTA